MSVALSVIIPLYGFQRQREAAFKNMLATLDVQDLKICDAANNPTDLKNFEVFIVEQESDNTHVIPEREYMHHIVLPKQEKGFNKSWCMNVAAKKASAETLVFIDVDMIFDKTFFARIRNFKTPNLKFFICWQYIVHMPGKDNPIARIVTKDILTAGGSFCVDKKFFWEVGGMNENYFGYGAEDNDLWVRVNRQLGSGAGHNVPSMPYALGHWYHDWAAPSPDRFYPLNRTNQFTNEVMNRLSKASLGNPVQPTLIDISDLQLKEAGVEEGKASKGLRQ